MTSNFFLSTCNRSKVKDDNKWEEFFDAKNDSINIYSFYVFN